MAEQMMQDKASEMAATQTVPKGYKQSEVGVIPEDWEVQPLSKLSARITDGEHLTPERTDFGYYLLSARNIHNGYLNLSDVDYVGESEYLRIRKRCNPDEGDVLISCSGTIGRVCVLPKGIECVMVRSAALIKSGDNKINGHYVQYFLQSSAGQKQIFSSLNQGAQANLFLNHIQDLRLAYPRIFAEQITIANALADTDALIAGLEQLIAKKQAIKTATMQQLLTGRTRLPQFALRPDGTPKGYKPSELGQIPEDWDALTYGDIFTFLSTATNSRADLSNSGDFGYIHYGDIHTKWNNKLDLCVFDLPRVSRHLVSSSFVENGDVIMADASEDYDGIGKSVEICNVGDDKIVSGLHTFLLRDKNQLLVDGYRGFLHSIPAVKKAFDRLATGMKVYGISKNNLIVVPVPLPPKQEQTAIATILSDMDSELTALELKLAKAHDLKQGMMQQLLTGKTRLKKPLKEAVHE